ncbi:MAG: hypothetical protein ACXWFZ_11445 [Nitrososphaeraceae archaeon]
MSNLYALNIEQVANGIKNREFTCEEYVSQIIERIKKVDKKINSFITINDDALVQAQHNLTLDIKPTKNVIPGNYTLTVSARYENSITYSKIIDMIIR